MYARHILAVFSSHFLSCCICVHSIKLVSKFVKLKIQEKDAEYVAL